MKASCNFNSIRGINPNRALHPGELMPITPFREILVFVAGSTPQVITETIQALVCQQPPIIPDRVHIVTTAANKKLIITKLTDAGILGDLCLEYEIPELELHDDNFLILRDRQGYEIKDLWTIEENEAAADQIVGFLRKLAADPGTRLHCSLAGGRKTMSYFMGLAFQLVARQWDRLYHVMVSPDFEKNADFYYKPRIATTINAQLLDGSIKTLNTDDAQVSLIQLPLIYLRDKLFPTGDGVREMVAEGQRSIDSSSVQLPVFVNLTERTLYIGATLIELPPAQLTIYTAFLRLKNRPCKLNTRDYCHECSTCFVPLVEMTEQPFIEAMADDYQQIYSADPLKREELLEKWLRHLDRNNLSQQISKINRTIKDELNDETLQQFYLITSKRKYGGSRYGILAEKGKISIV
jgi:CRISPR-associated protein Csx14